jgi:murein DD-endopeptidase MepM/ murein hydrolase activator NlpD
MQRDGRCDVAVSRRSEAAPACYACPQHVRWWFLCAFAIGCEPPPVPAGQTYVRQPVEYQRRAARVDPARAGTVVDRRPDFVFDGGRIDFELRRDGDRVIDVAVNHYAIPLVVAWQVDRVGNLEPTSPSEGVAVLPARDADVHPIVLATYVIVRRDAPFVRDQRFSARFGDPRARATAYAYRLPYPSGRTFSVLQGFHGAFSHRGSNEYAVDFDCPQATPVIAARPGVVVAANAAAQGAGTTPEFQEYRRVNFILVRHDDGTLGEYMHLAPSGVSAQPGQRVERGDELGLSGNTGFSSTPHLHFQVMTAAGDGVSARSFPIAFAIAEGRVGEPVQGRAYQAWE